MFYPTWCRNLLDREEYLRCLRNLRVGDIIRLGLEERYDMKVDWLSWNYYDSMIQFYQNYRIDAQAVSHHAEMKLPMFAVNGVGSVYYGMNHYGWNFRICSPIYKLLKKQ